MLTKREFKLVLEESTFFGVSTWADPNVERF